MNPVPLGEQGDIPWRVRQAAAAAAAAGQGAQTAQPSSAGLHAPQQQEPHLQQQQQRPEQQPGEERQENVNQPALQTAQGLATRQKQHQQQSQPQQAVQEGPKQMPLQQQQKQQQQRGVLTQQPVVRHPLYDPAAADAGPSKGALPKPMSALNLSDSIEQDYVVVINPFKPDIAMARRHAEQHQSSSSHSQSNVSLNQQQQEVEQPAPQGQGQQQEPLAGGQGMLESMCTASEASTGSHANSSAIMSAAVAALEGQPVSSGGFGQQQQQQQASLSLGQCPQLPGALGGVKAVRDRQLSDGGPGVAAAAAAGWNGGGTAAAADWVGRAPTSLRGTASELLQLQQNVNKVQLFAQVLRGITELLQQQEAGNEGMVPLQQQAESVALRLFALQLLSLVCIPQQQELEQQQEGTLGQEQQQEVRAQGQQQQGVGVRDVAEQQMHPAAELSILEQQQLEEQELSGTDHLLSGPSHSQNSDSLAFAAAGSDEDNSCGVVAGSDAAAIAVAGNGGDLLLGANHQDLQLLMASAVQLLQLLQSSAQEEQGLGAQSLFGSILKQRTEGQMPQQLLQACAGAAGAAVEGSGDQSRLALAAVSEAAMPLVLPDPLQVLYQHALSSSRSAAVEELMGNWAGCVSGYSTAADLLMFLAMEWVELEGWSGGLSWSERVRVHGLYAAVYGRLMLCLKEQGEGSS